MRTDGLFKVNKFKIMFNNYGEKINLSATGDWHFGCSNHDSKKFIEFLEDAKEKNAYLIGTGDYIDLLSSSERRGFINADMHDQTTETFDQLVYNKVKALADLIKKYYGNRIIGLGGGNHYHNLSYGKTSDQLLCEMLGCEYLGVNSITRLTYQYKSNKTNTFKLDICVHHGLSGGRTAAASINKLQMMANSFDADIMLQGHDHNRCVDYINRIGLSDNGVLINKRILLGRTGSFLKSYQPGKSSYAVEALYAPGDLGGINITITPKRTITKNSAGKVEDIKWLDIEATI